jgi:hypothetical protein
MAGLTYLKYAGTVGRPPCIEEVVFASADKPLATVGKLKRQNTTFVEVELVLVWLAAVKDLHVAALHSETQIQATYFTDTAIYNTDTGYLLITYFPVFLS